MSAGVALQFQMGGSVNRRRSSWVRRGVDPIAIDFGARCVRMLQLAHQSGQTTVIGCAERVIPPGPHTPADMQRIREKAVGEMLAEGQFVGREVVSCLGWEDMQVRNLRIPVMPESEVGEVIRYEAAERLGVDADQTELRFIVAGDVRQGTDIRLEVIVFAANRSVVEDHVRMLSRMGLRPAAIDAGPCALFRGFERFLRRDEDQNAVNAVVDLGYSASRVVMSRGPEIIFFKSIPIGGQKFDEMVSEQMDMSIVDAADLRVRLHRQHTAGMTDQEAETSQEHAVSENVKRAVLDTLRPPLEQLAKEIALCLRYCSVTFRGLRSDEVTAIGGEACNADLLQTLSDHVNLPFRVGRPMRHLPSEPDFGGSDRRTGQPEWATALGLALKPVPSMERAEVAA